MAEILSPPLSGLAQARFVGIGQQLRFFDSQIGETTLAEIWKCETAWAESPAGRRELRGEVAAYRASIRALLDLIRVGWRVESDRGTLELIPPAHLQMRLTPEQVRAQKEVVRRNLWPIVAAQLNHPEFRRLVRRLEKPLAKAKTKPIGQLVATGNELAQRLAEARTLPKDKRGPALARAILPYLQLVSEGARDEYTNLLLSDIYRYFRATWSIPNLSVPGRSMLYLIRDAAHPRHAVMGLLSLNNAPMRKRSVDEWVGWTPARLRDEAQKLINAPSGSPHLAKFIDDCLSVLRSSAAAICSDKLASEMEIAKPTPKVARRLLTLGDQFDVLREKVLKGIGRQKASNVSRRDRKAPADMLDLDLPPLEDDLPDLDRATPDQASRLARRLLVAKKRAYELSRLLQAQITLTGMTPTLTDPKRAATAWSDDGVATALSTVCAAMKSARLSSDLLEVTTCGAVAPYSNLLGGKLAALLCFSPEIAADYEVRYGSEPAIIRSHMANRPVPADSRLVALVTTSLYAVGSSQYERLRLPAGIIAPDQPELRISQIGRSSGFGTIHFTPETTAEIESFAQSQREYTDVNSVFGEGPSPKLRKLRAGLDLLGFSADDLLRHHQIRIVYALEFWPGATEFLRFGRGSVPSWIDHPKDFRAASARIAAFWRERWLASRLDHDVTWQRLLADQSP